MQWIGMTSSPVILTNIVGYVPCISINCYCMYPCICRIYYRKKKGGLRLVPINAHVKWWHAVQVRGSRGSQNEDKTLLQHSQLCHKGEFRDVSISVRQRSLRCGQRLRGPFLRATLPMRVGLCALAMADNGETKGLITPPTRWVSAQLLYVYVTAW